MLCGCARSGYHSREPPLRFAGGNLVSRDNWLQAGATVNAGQKEQVDELRAEIKKLQGLVPDQAAIMTHVGYHWTNLWFAIEKENWPLAEFYLSETRANVKWAVRAPSVERVSRYGLYSLLQKTATSVPFLVMASAGWMCPLTPLSMRIGGGRSAPCANNAGVRISDAAVERSIFINRLPGSMELDFIDAGWPITHFSEPRWA
jgi:hypothetical protein